MKAADLLRLLLPALLLPPLFAGSAPASAAAMADLGPRERPEQDANSEPPPPPPAWVWVDGEGELSEAVIEVDCGEADLGLIVRVASCSVRASFRLSTSAGLSLRAATDEGLMEHIGGLPDYVEVDGEALTGEPRRLMAGSSVQVRIEHHVTVATSIELDTEPFVIRPNAARHLLLGESADIDRDDGSFMAYLVTGPQLRISGQAELRRSAPDHVEASTFVWNAEGQQPRIELRLGIEAIEEAGEVFQNGGPVLSIGVRIRNLEDEEAGSDLLLGLGYEVALFENVFVRAAFETDLSSMYQSLVVEAATPHLLYIVPSLVAGIGGVVAERPDGRVEGALRVRLAGQLPMLAIGIGADLDYWPESGTWSGGITVRASF